MKCSNREYLKCSDCSNKKLVLESVNKFAEKKLGNKIGDFKTKIEEDTDFYTVTYTNREYSDNPLKKGGGGSFSLTISKKNCKIIDYRQFK